MGGTRQAIFSDTPGCRPAEKGRRERGGVGRHGLAQESGCGEGHRKVWVSNRAAAVSESMFESGELWSPIRLTLLLACITTLLLIIIGAPIAWWLVRSKARL